jgi:hypothetical protein
MRNFVVLSFTKCNNGHKINHRETVETRNTTGTQQQHEVFWPKNVNVRDNLADIWKLDNGA